MSQQDPARDVGLRDMLAAIYAAGIAPTPPSPHRTRWKRNLPPLPPPPAWAIPDPPVVGRPEEARAAKALLDLHPVVKSRVRRVIVGPSRGFMELLSPEALSRLERSTILGVHYRPTQDIGINPGLLGDEALFKAVLAHELGHAADLSEERIRRVIHPLLGLP